MNSSRHEFIRVNKLVWELMKISGNLSIAIDYLCSLDYVNSKLWHHFIEWIFISKKIASIQFNLFSETSPSNPHNPHNCTMTHVRRAGLKLLKTMLPLN